MVDNLIPKENEIMGETRISPFVHFAMKIRVESVVGVVDERLWRIIGS